MHNYSYFRIKKNITVKKDLFDTLKLLEIENFKLLLNAEFYYLVRYKVQFCLTIQNWMILILHQIIPC